MVYDCKFQTVMGDYEANDNITTHIWESMVETSTENVTNEIQETHGTIPNLHQDWLTRDEQDHKDNDNINYEVMRRLHKLQCDSQENTPNTLESSDPMLRVHDTQSIIQPPLSHLMTSP